MSIVRNAGDRMLFREDFWNSTMVGRNDGVEVGAPVIDDGLSGGQVVWYGKAHTYAFDRDISVVVECISVASGSNQALLSIGTLAARRLEFGIDALGQPYAWGTAQVNLGLPVDDGPHIFGFSVDTYGNVTCVVDGVLWGTGTVTFGPLTTRMVAAGSCLGGLDWGATVRPIRIYGYAADYATLVSLCGLPASAVWTPDLMLVGRDGLYEDLDAAGAVTLNTQPVLLNTGWETGTLEGWIGYSVGTVSVSSALPYLGTYALRSTASAASSYGHQRNSSSIAGCRYLYSVAARANKVMIGNIGTSSPVVCNLQTFWNTFTGDRTEGLTSFVFGDFGGAVIGDWMEIDALVTKNLSTSLVTCKGNKGNLAQATPASMTWSSDPQAPTSVPRVGRTVLYSDGAADHNVSTLAAADWPLHQATGFTYAEVLQVAAAAAGNDTLVDSCNRSALSHGINANYDVTNRKLVVSVANGSGMFVVSEGMTIAPGKTITVDATWTEVDGLEVSVNGAPPMTQPTLDGKSVLFDGVNDYVDADSCLPFDLPTPFTFTFWINMPSVGGSTGKIIARQASGIPYGFSIGANIQTNYYRIGFEQINSFPSYWNSRGASSRLEFDTWYFVAVSWNGNASGDPAGIQSHINSLPVPQVVGNSTLGARSFYNPAGKIWIGSRQFSPVYMGAALKYIAAWNKVLSTVEISELYNSGVPLAATDASFTESLLTYWPMGEGDTYPTLQDRSHGAAPSAAYPTILDLSGSGFHGTMTNMAVNDIVLDSPGGDFSKFSLELDGVNDFLDLGNNFDMAFDAPITFSIWIKYTSSTYAHIFAKMTSTIWRGYQMAYDATNLYFNMQTANYMEGIVTYIPTLNDGLWHNVIYSYDGSGTAAGVAWYVDGVPTAHVTATDNLAGRTVVSTQNLNIGRRASGNYFPGRVNEFSIWNASTSPAQAVEIFNGGVPTDNRLLSSAPNLVGYWRMGDDVRFDGTMVNMAASNIVDMGPSAAAASATLQDGRTSGGADFFQGYRADKLVLVGKATAGELANWRRYTAAKYGIDTRPKACQFNGVNQYVNMGNVLGYERTNEFSTSFWAKWSGATYYIFLGKQQSGPERGYAIATTTTGQIEVGIMNEWPINLIYLRTTDGGFNDNLWHHVTVAYDGSSTAAGVSIHVDGVEYAKTVVYDSLSATIVTANSFYVGARASGGPNYFAGRLDEVSVWAKTLTPAEVVEIHNAALPINLRTTTCRTSLAAWWRMGDSDVFPTLLDSSGNGYHGTMTNMLATDIIDRT